MKAIKMVKPIFAGTILGIAFAFSPLTLASSYPEETIRIVVPWSAGGGTDAVARALAEGMKDHVDVSVIIDNVSGAAGATGTTRVAKSNADGYTILLNGTSEITSGLTFRNLPFTLDDFKYVGTVYSSPTWMLSHQDSSYSSFDDFISEAKSSPGELAIGVGGASGAHMIMASAIKGMLDIDVRIIPFEGGQALRTALIGNKVDAGVIHAPVLLSEIEAGIINILASGASLEDINYEPIRDSKTLKDYGLDVKFSVARAVMVPKNTPDDIVAKLSSIVEESVDSEKFKKFGESFGFSPVWIDGEKTKEIIYDDLQRFKEIKTEYID